jgi:hypothetical protein
MGTKRVRRPISLDPEVERAQAALLDRVVAGWSSRRVQWSGDDTQVIEDEDVLRRSASR